MDLSSKSLQGLIKNAFNVHYTEIDASEMLTFLGDNEPFRHKSGNLQTSSARRLLK